MSELQTFQHGLADYFDLRVLLIGAPEPEVRILRATLENRQIERIQIVEAASAEEGLAILHQQRCHMLVLDDEPQMSTRRKSLELLRQAAPSTPIVLRIVYRCHQAEADAAQVGAEAVLPRGELPLLRQMVLRLARRSGPGGIVREES